MKPKFRDLILFYLSVPKCVACKQRLDVSTPALCDNCRADYERAKRVKCSVCFKPYSECSCVNKYLDAHFVHKLYKLSRYGKPAYDGEIIPQNELIYNVKRDNRRDIVAFLSDELAAVISPTLRKRDYIITSVPRQRKRVLKYGFDHSEKIARALAKKLNIKYRKLLRSAAKQAQKKTHGEERMENAKFLPIKDIDLRGKSVILFDDVVTTGASMGACAMQLKALGAKEIIGATALVAFKDRYEPFVSDK